MLEEVSHWRHFRFSLCFQMDALRGNSLGLLWLAFSIVQHPLGTVKQNKPSSSLS